MPLCFFSLKWLQISLRSFSKYRQQKSYIYPKKKCKRKRKVNPVGRSMSFLGKRGYRPKEEVGNLPSQFLSFFYLEKNFNFGDIMKLCSNC